MKESWAGEADPPETREEQRVRAVPVSMPPLRLHEDPNPPGRRIGGPPNITNGAEYIGKKTAQVRLDFF